MYTEGPSQQQSCLLLNCCPDCQTPDKLQASTPSASLLGEATMRQLSSLPDVRLMACLHSHIVHIGSPFWEQDLVPQVRTRPARPESCCTSHRAISDCNCQVAPSSARCAMPTVPGHPGLMFLSPHECRNLLPTAMHLAVCAWLATGLALMRRLGVLSHAGLCKAMRGLGWKLRPFAMPVTPPRSGMQHTLLCASGCNDTV